jgi:hypothetical protein
MKQTYPDYKRFIFINKKTLPDLTGKVFKIFGRNGFSCYRFLRCYPAVVG